MASVESQEPRHPSPQPPHPQRTEPLLLKPTTLPHNPASSVDTGAAGERIETAKPKPETVEASTLTPSPSVIELVQSASQTIHTQATLQGSSSWSRVFLISLRLSFYILVLTLTLGLTLAAFKFTNIWDPCGVLYINTTECKVTNYLKGMVFHSQCVEEHYCILPGFQSSLQRQEWSFLPMNETGSNQRNVVVSLFN